MKRLLAFLVFLILSTTLCFADTTTTNYSLTKPSRGSTSWDTSINANFDTIDSQMKTNADAIPSADGTSIIDTSGTWSTSLGTSIATTELASPTGADTNVVTGTAGTSGTCAEWNADGDLVEAASAAACGSGSSFDSTTVDATTWSDGANASNVWTFDVSGTDTTLTVGSALWTISSGVTVTGALTAGTGGTALTLGGKIDGYSGDAGYVNDDDCTSQQGFAWYDSSDQKWEFCNNGSGAPVAIGSVDALTSDSAPVTSSAGDIAFDTNAWASGRGAGQLGDGTDPTYILAALVSDTPNDGQVPKWNTGGTITWENDNNTAGITAADTCVLFSDGADNPACDTSDFNYNKTTNVLTVGSVNTAPTSTPTQEFYDSDTVDGDLNAKVVVDCTNIYSGTEDCNFVWSAQKAGTMTENMRYQPASGLKVSGGQITGAGYIRHVSKSFDPAAWYDQESTYRVVPLFRVAGDSPSGITLTSWYVNYVGGNPATELDADIMCDTTPDFNPAAGATVMDVIDTTTGSSSATGSFDSANCANGSQVYIRFGADPTDANVVVAFDMTFVNQ